MRRGTDHGNERHVEHVPDAGGSASGARVRRRTPGGVGRRCGAGAAQAQAEPAEVKVLFLGDDGHHRPFVRAKEILPVLAYNGVDMFYTDAPAI
jgi:hypothetical protein